MLPRKGGPDSFSTLGAITEFQLRPGHILVIASVAISKKPKTHKAATTRSRLTSLSSLSNRAPVSITPSVKVDRLQTTAPVELGS